MTDTPYHVARALDAFLAEHRGCWRVHGQGLQSGEDMAVLWLGSPCGGRLSCTYSDLPSAPSG